jgi:glycosyltransferase involved in cell wall biosynthesis
MAPTVTVIVPAYHEEDSLRRNLGRLVETLAPLADRYTWDFLIVNDGSRDATGAIADALAREYPLVRVIHHARNRGLGAALRTGFANARGAYAVTVDADLSYAPTHVAALLDALERTGADIVLASPYMPGGKTTAVPPNRLFLSRWANRFLARLSREKLSTFTGMVRAYRTEFLRRLNLKADGMEVNPEIIYKASLLGGHLEEIPAHLDWTELNRPDLAPRRISFKTWWHILVILFHGFIFRPGVFFLIPGCAAAALALVLAIWVGGHITSYWAATAAPDLSVLDHVSAAAAVAYRNHGHVFFALSFVALSALHLVSLGVLATQAKRYFEELFHLGSRPLRNPD